LKTDLKDCTLPRLIAIHALFSLAGSPTPLGMISAPHPALTGNRILDALPEQEIVRLRGRLRPTNFAPKHVLYNPGDRIDFIYFPVTAVFSVSIPLNDGSSIEMGTVGNEGFFGLAGLFGDGVAKHEVAIQASGNGFRVATSAFREELERCKPWRDLCLKLSQLVVAEISQTAACNARHSLRSRCASWLLAMQDKVGTRSFAVNQEALATLLGVQRTGLSVQAQTLRREGLIQYRRGLLEICDRARLEATACECYAIMRDLREGFLRT
jgi:CRP-like cAMP-binding protein